MLSMVDAEGNARDRRSAARRADEHLDEPERAWDVGVHDAAGPGNDVDAKRLRSPGDHDLR